MSDIQVNIMGNDGLVELMIVTKMGKRQIVKTKQAGVSLPISNKVIEELITRHNDKLARARASHDIRMHRSI